GQPFTGRQALKYWVSLPEREYGPTLKGTGPAERCHLLLCIRQPAGPGGAGWDCLPPSSPCMPSADCGGGGCVFYSGASISAAANGALLWEHKKGVAFLREMGYKGGSLICNKSGHYYVYSNLFLGHSDCPVTHQSYLFVTHTIYKRTSQYPEEMELLTNSIPYCNLKDSQLWSHNSFLAGVVHLEENEEVFIKVSQMHLVRVSEESRTYFGTFMI
uniref:TNF superfamily member 14 n=1 Tax=Varanus komodoensis TaxID=61221 RepID=A0A8D2Q4Q8_VARKO